MTERLLRLCLLSVFVAFGSNALAQESDCTDPQTQDDMTLCAVKDYEKADAALNEVWDEAMFIAQDEDALMPEGDTGPGYEETLREAQRAWITFRDAHCAYAGFAARGGTMQPLLVNQCLARLTGERTTQLRKLVQEMGTQ